MLPEVLVSSLILLILVTQSQKFFSESLGAIDGGRRNDSIVTRVQQDLEDIRHCVSLYALPISIDTSGDWSCHDVTRSQTMPSGQLIYLPDENACFNGTLASNLIDQSILPVNGIIDNNEVRSLDDVTIERQITADPDNENLLKVTYTTTRSGSSSSVESFTLSIPAQAWCP